jgi:predicted DNA-binding transcriptional regulator YafY
LNLDAAERAVLRLALSNPALRAAPDLTRRLRVLSAKLHAATPPEDQQHDRRTRAVLRLALSNPALRAAPDLTRRLRVLSAKLHAATPPEDQQHDRRTRAVLRLADTQHSGPNAELALEPLRRAARDHRTVEIDYDSLSDGQRSRRHLDPHELFERSGAWYLAGHCHHHNEVRIFRLDRVSNVTPTDQPFTPPPNDASRNLLAHAWNLMQEGGDHTVILRFDSRLAPLVLNARLHPDGHAEVMADGSVRYTVQLDGLEEVARWIVGFGGGCVVEGPGELGEMVLGVARGAVTAHQGASSERPEGTPSRA